MDIYGLIRRSRYLSDLFHDIIHEGSLYKTHFQEGKSRLISNTSAPSVNNVVFVFLIVSIVWFSQNSPIVHFHGFRDLL